jgi:hypothetical protein
MNIRLCIFPALLLSYTAHFHAAEKNSLVLPILKDITDLLELPPEPYLPLDIKNLIFTWWSENFSIQQAAPSLFKVQTPDVSYYPGTNTLKFMHNGHHLHTIFAPLVPENKKDAVCNFIGPIAFPKKDSLLIINRPNSHPLFIHTQQGILAGTTRDFEPLKYILEGSPGIVQARPGTVKVLTIHPYKPIFISQHTPTDTEKLPSLALHVLNIDFTREPGPVTSVQSYPMNCSYNERPAIPIKIWITPDNTSISFYKDFNSPYEAIIGIADLYGISPCKSFIIDGQKLVKENLSHFPPGWQTHSVSVKYSVSHPRLLLVCCKSDPALKRVCPIIYSLTKDRLILTNTIAATSCDWHEKSEKFHSAHYVYHNAPEKNRFTIDYDNESKIYARFLMFAQQWLQSLPQKSLRSLFSWNATQTQLTDQQLESGLGLIRMFNTALPSPMKFLYCTKKTNPLQKIHAKLRDDVILRASQAQTAQEFEKIKVLAQRHDIFPLFTAKKRIEIEEEKTLLRLTSGPTFIPPTIIPTRSFEENVSCFLHCLIASKQLSFFEKTGIVHYEKEPYAIKLLETNMDFYAKIAAYETLKKE